jgi:hypothetical protein
MTEDRIVAIGLLTAPELESLGSSFKRAWPIDEGPCFSGLLQAIDQADRECWRERDSERQG